MNSDSSSLNNLRDIAVPPPVSWWPLAPGWWFIIVLIISVLSYIAYRAWCNWCASAYRRAALCELNAATTIADVSNILKRTALVAFPRGEVASLSGKQWCTWLQRTGTMSLPAAVLIAFTKDVFSNQQTQALPEVIDFAEAWIRSHEPTTEKVTSSAFSVSKQTPVEATAEC